MKFEQAFYTREMESGLGIVASSDSTYEFRQKCLAVGSQFDTESTDETAQFVYYSKDFGRYVGVGVSPASYEDGRGKNKLVHIYIPEIASANPSDYYLPYEFDRSVNKEKHYESREFQSSISEDDFRVILDRYHLDQSKLAGLLWKAVPVALGKQNQLAVVISEELHDRCDFPVIAREITWLLNRLIPVAGEEKDRYSTNLSYAVLSVVNNSVANIAYVGNADAFSNYFLLDEAYWGEIPELYLEFAKRALISKEEYDAFVAELFEYRIEQHVDMDGLQMMFVQWQLKHTDKKLKKAELPMTFDTLIGKARKVSNFKYREFLYLVVGAVEDITPMDLTSLLKGMFRPIVSGYPEECMMPEFLSAYENAITLAYAGKYSVYREYVQGLNEDKQKTIITNLWGNGMLKSCVVNDIECASSAEECLEKIRLYESLWDNEEFILKMRELIVDKYYFPLKRKDRMYVSSILDCDMGNDCSEWKEMLRAKIAEIFETDGYIPFLEGEIEKAEEGYVPLYFSYFLRNCQRTENPEVRVQLQNLGRRFLECYGSLVSEQDGNDFYELDYCWNQEDIHCRMELLSLDELSGFTDFGEFFKEYKVEFLTAWYQLVVSRLKNEALPEAVLEAVIERLVARKDELSCLDKEKQTEYMDAIWEACGENLNWRLYCSIKLEPTRYSIWTCVGFCDSQEYEQIFNMSESNFTGCYAPIEEKDIRDTVSESAEFNKCCYLLWKQIHQKKSCTLERFAAFDLKAYELEFAKLLESLQNDLIEQVNGTDRRPYIDYIKIEIKKELWFDDSLTPAELCLSFKQLKENHFQFYRGLLQVYEYGLDHPVLKRLQAIKVFERLDSRSAVGEDNLSEMAGLLNQAETKIGCEPDLVVRLNEEYEDVMKKLKQEQEEEQRQINQYTIELNETKEMIKNLKKKAKDLEEKLDNATRRRDKKKRQQDNAKKARKGESKSTRSNPINPGSGQNKTTIVTTDRTGRLTGDADDY